jgi:hypothetical protein
MQSAGHTVISLSRQLDVQQYLDINRPLLEFIVTMGADTALVSDAARAWLEIKDHYEGLNNKSVDRISKSGHLASDVADIKHHAMKRIDSGITGAHYLALFLDPRLACVHL